jgi:hypothetical protein
MKIPFDYSRLPERLSTSERNLWRANDFSGRIEALKRYYVDLSSRGIPYWSYFTLHDESHVERVLHNILAIVDRLPRRSPVVRLNGLEVFILIAAAFVHDIGMFLPVSDKDVELLEHEAISAKFVERHKRIFDTLVADRSFSEQKEEGLGIFIRDMHHLRSGIFIRHLSNAAALQISELKGAIALVAEGHRKVDLYSGRYRPEVLGAAFVRLDLLAAILRVADELDVLHDRVPDALRVINSPSIDAETRKHWVRHYVTDGLMISANDYGSYVFELFYKTLVGDEAGLFQRRILDLIATGIDSQLQYTGSIFQRYGIVIPAKVTLTSRDPRLGVVGREEIDGTRLKEIFFEREIQFHCPSVDRYLGSSEMVTVEQRGQRLVCLFDEKEHRKGTGSFCVSSAGVPLDCGFCAIWGTARITEPTADIRFFCPIYSGNMTDPEDCVSLRWIPGDSKAGSYVCSGFTRNPKEWCQRCGFGGKRESGQKVLL